MPTNETALLSTIGLDEELRGIVREACELGGVDLRCSDFSELADSGAPDLLLGVLPQGQRSLPRELRQAAVELYPSTPLLLLCREPLVQGSISLEDGRLLLLGTPHSPEQLVSRMRLALRSRNRPSTVLDEDSGGRSGGSHLVVEHRFEACWVATIEHRAQGEEESEREPCLRLNIEGRKLSCKLPSSSGLPGDSARAGGSAIRFDGERQSWTIERPAPTWSVWLLSERRAPPFWDVGAWFAEEALPAHELAAASGDLLLSVQGSEEAAGRSGALQKALLHAARHGGPAVLDQLVRELESASVPTNALLMEVR